MNVYKRIITTKELRKLLPYLTEYFGITYQHFSFEIGSEIIEISLIQRQLGALGKAIFEKEQEKQLLEDQIKDSLTDDDVKIRHRQRIAILKSEINNKRKEGETIVSNTESWKLEYPIGGAIKYTDFLNYDMDLSLYYDFDLNDFNKLFNTKRNPAETDIVVDRLTTDILYLVAMIVKRRKLFEKANIMHYSRNTPYNNVDELEKKHKRIDLLELYLLLNEIKANKHQPITITHPRGKRLISNHNHWFESFLSEHLNVALTEIQTVEQAQEELKTYAPKKGRRAINHKRDVLIYGIYRLFKEHLKIGKEMPNDLSDIIIGYLDFVGLPIDMGKRHPQNIKVQIDNIKKNPARHKFEYLI